jgi:hypothetical protein
MSKRKGAWKIWALALGEKASKHDHEADKVALIRTLIFASYLITNIAIIANAWRHWNDDSKQPDGVMSCLKATKKGAEAPFAQSVQNQ